MIRKVGVVGVIHRACQSNDATRLLDEVTGLHLFPRTRPLPRPPADLSGTAGLNDTHDAVA